MKLSVAIGSCFFIGALTLVAGAPGCGGDDPGTSGTAGATGAAGTTGEAGTSGQAGTLGNAGRGGDTGTAGTTGDAGRGGTTGTGGRGNGGTTGTGGRGNGGSIGTGTAGRGGTTGTAGRGGTTGSGGRAGTGGGAAGGAGGAATFAQVATILGTSCGTGDCHNGTDHVDLRNNTGLYTRIVNGSPSGAKTMSSCTSRKLIVPNNVAMSVIAQAVMASVSGCTNARMPDDCPTTNRPCLTTAQINTITSWINAGAPM
jgi:hypothetical protein